MQAVSTGLSAEQESVADDITHNLDEGTMHQVLVGLAGTGKTTVAKSLYDRWVADGHNVMAIAPTGKAAMVLRSKGVPAVTIHSAIYKYLGKYEDDRGKLNLAFEDAKRKLLVDRLIVDEGSMIDLRTYRDISGKGVPTLWVGDPGQLPPVRSKASGLMENPTHTLTEIHRQAGNNPIIRWAHALRNDLGLQSPFQGINHVRVDGRGPQYICRTMRGLGIDRLVVKTNAQRIAINSEWRAMMGRKGPPDCGDEIVCLLNNRQVDVVNGQVFRVLKRHQSLPEFDANVLTLECVLTGYKLDRVLVWEKQFGIEQSLDWDEVPEDVMVADFATAMTCHKMQGSSEKHIGIVARGFCGDPRTWNYTAATRAEESATVFC